jgi:hypothetical protein
MGVYLEDLPVVGAPQPAAKPGEPAAPATDPAAAPESQDDANQPDPANPDPAAVAPATELVAATGRKFKDQAELLTTYNESAKEAQRLFHSERTAMAKAAAAQERVEMANKALLEMQSQIGSGAFPGLKQEDGTYLREVTQETNEESRMNFYAEKREWQRKQADLKKSLESVKANAEAYATRVQEAITKTEQAMTSDSASFPDYDATKEIREDILAQSPYLANKEETPYTTYLMAMGLKAIKERQAVSKVEADNKAKAAATAGAAASSSAAAGAAAGGARATQGKDRSLDTIVSSFKKRMSY